MNFFISPRVGRGDFVFGVVSVAALWVAGLYTITGGLLFTLELGFKTEIGAVGREPFEITILRLFCDALLVWFAIRRLRDAGYNGLYVLVPIVLGLLGPIGAVLMITSIVAILVLPGEIGPNRFGPDPRGWKSKEQYDEQRRRIETGEI